MYRLGTVYITCQYSNATVILFLTGGSVDGCPAPSSDCHPSCIVYDAAHCRYCRCSDGKLTLYFIGYF